MPQKYFTSALSQNADAASAVDELTRKIQADLDGRSCELAVLFMSEGYGGGDPHELVEIFRNRTSPSALIGCNANGVVGDKKEIEMEPAISVLAMHLPDGSVTPFSVSPQVLEFSASADQLMGDLDLLDLDEPKFIVFADPMSCDVTKMLSLFNQAHPGAPVVGGLSSGGVVGAKNWLVLNQEFYGEGAIGVALTGDIRFDIVVSQGCRPIGEPMAVTKADRNILYELAGKPALDSLRDIHATLSPEDQELAQHSLFVGLAMDERRTNFKRGDFLIRNIMGADNNMRAIAIGEVLEIGQTLQFQLRDAKAATEELEILLTGLGPKGPSCRQGGLLVSCCGRGKGLFGEGDHDARMIQSINGPVPLSGFFANGEFGPINNKNYVHGYTSSLTILS